MKDKRIDLPTGVAIGIFISVAIAALTALNPFREWSTSEILNLLVALGTFGAAAAALYTSWYGNKNANRRLERDIAARRRETREVHDIDRKTLQINLMFAFISLVHFTKEIIDAPVANSALKLPFFAKPHLNYIRNAINIDNYLRALISANTELAKKANGLRWQLSILDSMLDDAKDRSTSARRPFLETTLKIAESIIPLVDALNEETCIMKATEIDGMKSRVENVMELLNKKAPA